MAPLSVAGTGAVRGVSPAPAPASPARGCTSCQSEALPWAAVQPAWASLVIIVCIIIYIRRFLIVRERERESLSEVLYIVSPYPLLPLRQVHSEHTVLQLLRRLLE